ncbi:hypothetical protein [Spirillospora sp. NPDC048819]|uniref:hypothetical protein n=1 Tax=Spirillospora sp. NPDC048819 TaxID=3155268 RepID=UPI0033DEB771
MTTTSRRPPAKAPKNRPRERPADAAVPAPAKRRPAKSTPAKSTPAKSTPGTSTPGTSTPARRPASAKSSAKSAATKTAPTKTTKTTKTAKTAKSGAKAAAVRSRPAASRRTAAQAPPRAPFVLLIVGLLGGALVSLLLLNTVLAKDAFTLTRLQQSNKQLEQQRQAYEEDIAREGSPQGLSNKAKALGMKEAEDPAFFHTGTGRASDGEIRPVPHAAAASAGAAGVVGVPGTVVPGDGVPPALLGDGRGSGSGAP